VRGALATIDVRGRLAWCVGEEVLVTQITARLPDELYVGHSGEGLILLEDLRDGSCAALPLRADEVVYVPAFTALRTVNVGAEPLAYLGIDPADAGSDYAAVAAIGFAQVVLASAVGSRVPRRAQLRGGA